MSTSGGLVSQLLSSPEFWLAAPAVIALGIFGLVATVAVIRATRQDVPEVFGIFSAVFARRSSRVQAGGDPSHSPHGELVAEKRAKVSRDTSHADDVGGAS